MLVNTERCRTCPRWEPNEVSADDERRRDGRFDVDR
jgi:hypothetical protein